MSKFVDPDWIIAAIVVPKTLVSEVDDAFLCLNGYELSFRHSIRYLSEKGLPDWFADLCNAFYRVDDIQLNGIIGENVSDENLKAFIDKIAVDDDVEICELLIQYVEIKGGGAYERLEATIYADERLAGVAHIERVDDADSAEHPSPDTSIS